MWVNKACCPHHAVKTSLEVQFMVCLPTLKKTAKTGLHTLTVRPCLGRYDDAITPHTCQVLIYQDLKLHFILLQQNYQHEERVLQRLIH